MNTERYERALVARKPVLGEEYVKRNLDEADGLNQGLQDLLAEYAWSGTWPNDTLTCFRVGNEVLAELESESDS